MRKPTALSIEGSDSGGCTGIQADIKTFEALSVYGTTVVTAVTAQNTLGIYDVHDVPVPAVRAQLKAVLEDLPPVAIKVGMLTTVPVIRAVASSISKISAPIVVDPIMVSRTGTRLLRPTSLNSLIQDLFPLAALVTLNLPEAMVIANQEIRSESDAKTAARRIQACGPRAVLIKGGQAEGETIIDGLLDGREWILVSNSRNKNRVTIGAGSTLSAAITAYLALGETLPDAVERACAFVFAAINFATNVGKGPNPLTHGVAGLMCR